MAQRIIGRSSGLVCVCRPAQGISVDGGVEQHLEWSGVVRAECVVFIDVDLGEECLVAQATVGVVAACVDVGAVFEQVECVIEVGAGVAVLAVVCVETSVHLVEFSADAVLFSLEYGERDGVGVVGLHEPILLVFQPVAVGGELGEFVGFGRHESVELVVKHPGEGLPASWRDLHVLVVVLDEVLDVFDEDGLAGAVRSLGMSSGAHEVGIDVAVPVLGVRHDQSRAAGAAVDGAFEIVIVNLRGLGCCLVGGEHRLHLIPNLGRNKGFVGALVANAPVDHVALVIRVGQEPVHGGHGERLRRVLRRGQAGQASRGEFIVELTDSPLPRGVGLVGPFDERRPIRVGLHRAHLTAELIADANIEVTDGCLGRGAAGGGFLCHALDHLSREVAGVELRDGGHDPVQQHPGRRLVNVLRRRDEHDPGLLEREVDGHVIGTIARKPIDLVDDAVRDTVALDVLDHPHQLGPVGLASRLACVDELLDDHRAEQFGLAPVRLTLRGDGEALVGAALLGLLLGRDAQVGHRQSCALGRIDETAHRIGAHERGTHGAFSHGKSALALGRYARGVLIVRDARRLLRLGRVSAT